MVYLRQLTMETKSESTFPAAKREVGTSSPPRYDSEYAELIRREEEDDYPWLDCPEIMPWDEEPSAVSPEPPRPPESKYPLDVQMAIKRLEYGLEEERLFVLQQYHQVRSFRAISACRKPKRKSRYR